MKVTLESTSKIVELVTPSGVVPARVWEGTTEGGVKCHAFVTRIAAAADEDLAQFERELEQCRVPSVEISAYPLRLIL